MSNFEYGYQKNLGGIGFEEAITKVSEALKKEGFGILTEIDVQGTFKKKLGVDFRKYVILGDCNPVLAHKALEADPQIGLMLPCNVVVQDSENEEIIVSIANPKAMFELVDSPPLGSVAEEANERLKRVIGALG